MSAFSFNPIDGLLNKSAYPTSPSTEDAARGQIQSPLNQLRDYINANCVVKDGSIPINGTLTISDILTAKKTTSTSFDVGTVGTNFNVGVYSDSSRITYQNALVIDSIDQVIRVPTALSNLVELGSPSCRWKDVWTGTWNRTTNGFNKLTNGMIVQWGIGSFPNNTNTTVNFPTIFPNACGTVVASLYTTTGTYTSAHAINTLSTSSFKLIHNCGATVSYYWMALGW